MDTEFDPDNEDRVAQHRGKLRESIFLGAVINLGDEVQSHNVRVRNISSGGMMIDLAGPQPKGLVVVAEMKGVGQVSGHIAWSTENRAGVVFDRTVDPKLARHTPAPAPVAPLYGKIAVAEARRPGLGIR